MPPNGVIQLAFDRYLLPASVNRQSFVLLDASNNVVAPEKQPEVSYDPVARVVILSGRDGLGKPWLDDTLVYKVLIQVGPEPSGGVRSLDGATLDPKQERLIAFGVNQKVAAQPSPPDVDFCVDVLPIFVAKCSAPACHGTIRGGDQRPAAGLILETSAGIANTAIGRVAHGANTGGVSGHPSPAGPVFAVDMPLIDPGNPGNSWLVYKMELAAPPAAIDGGTTIACQGVADGGTFPPPAESYVPLVDASTNAGDGERITLGGFVIGQPMPYPVLPTTAPAYDNLPLTFDEREAVRLWIASMPANGQIRDCGACVAP